MSTERAVEFLLLVIVCFGFLLGVSGLYLRFLAFIDNSVSGMDRYLFGYTQRFYSYVEMVTL